MWDAAATAKPPSLLIRAAMCGCHDDRVGRWWHGAAVCGDKAMMALCALAGKRWKETHRWNFGLEEDLDETGDPIWNHPHLPWISALGLVELKVCASV